MGPVNAFYCFFTRSAVVMGRRYSSMFTVPPIETVSVPDAASCFRWSLLLRSGTPDTGFHDDVSDIIFIYSATCQQDNAPVCLLLQFFNKGMP